MSQERLKLVNPCMDYAIRFLVMAQEYLAAGDSRFVAVYGPGGVDVAAYIAQLVDQSHGIGLTEDQVPQNTYWMLREDDDSLIGTSRLRHRLNSTLTDMGGHIGYDIRPAERRKGYGTHILRLTLDKARELGFRRVLLTCAADNAGSARIIEKNGGQLDSCGLNASGVRVLRYWIAL